MSQGGNANKNGRKLEKRVEAEILKTPLEYITQHRYDSIYGHRAKMDFYFPEIDVAVEAKNQEGGGSVAEKLPYVMHSFEAHPASRGLLVLGGAYWKTKPGILAWAENYAESSEMDIEIIFEEDFKEWLFEQTETRCAA